MSQCEDISGDALIIQKHVGMNTINPGISATVFAVASLYLSIRRQSLPRDAAIFRRERKPSKTAAFASREYVLASFGHKEHKVIHVQFIELQRPLLQLNACGGARDSG